MDGNNKREMGPIRLVLMASVHAKPFCLSALTPKSALSRSETEGRLNKMPHFMADIKDDDGTAHKIHFAALFSTQPTAIPVIMIHGLPGRNPSSRFDIVPLSVTPLTNS